MCRIFQWCGLWVMHNSLIGLLPINIYLLQFWSLSISVMSWWPRLGRSSLCVLLCSLLSLASLSLWTTQQIANHSYKYNTDTNLEYRRLQFLPFAVSILMPLTFHLNWCQHKILQHLTLCHNLLSLLSPVSDSQIKHSYIRKWDNCERLMEWWIWM